MSLLFKTTCRQGEIKITEITIGVFSFGQTLWQAPWTTITGIEYQSGPMQTVTLAIHSTQGDYTVNMILRRQFDELCTHLPGVIVTETVTSLKPRFWYHDETKLTHIETYETEKDVQRDVESAYQHGWQIQGQIAQVGQISGSKIIAGAILAGPVGAMIGAIRGKGKITITFVRSSEWIAQHPRP